MDGFVDSFGLVIHLTSEMNCMLCRVRTRVMLIAWGKR